MGQIHHSTEPAHNAAQVDEFTEIMLNYCPALLSSDAVDQYTWAPMSVRENPSSYDYLSFAKQDLQDGHTSRHLVNSISNAKRSLHLRLEDLCLGFGARKLDGLKRFPQLLEYVQSCGIVAPEILRGLNTLRNDTEHDYKIPKLAEVETCIDVTALFLSATDRWRDRQPCDADYFQEIETKVGVFRVIGLTFDWKGGIARIKYLAPDATSRNAVRNLDYRSRSKEYFECVRFLLANNY